MQFKFNIPNKITIIRVGLIPLFAIILLVDIPYKRIFASFVFAMLSISDFLDGYFARKKKQVTEFGKLIDPIADKLLISTALVFLVVQGYEGIYLWMAVSIIAREIVITAIRIYLLPSKIVVPASNFGKAKTIVQSIGIVFVLLELPLSWHVMLAAVLLTIISGLEYVIKIKQMTGNKIVNLPNIITLFRFLMIFPFVYYFFNSRINISLLVFAIITLSDKLDGISARLMNQKTELGSGFDSFTDWTLIIVTFFIFLIRGYINFWWFISFVIPSMLNGVIKMVYAKKHKIVPITFIARLSVGITYMTIISVLIKFPYNSYLLTATLVMVYLAMSVYIFRILNVPRKVTMEVF